jgi:hypothetical protein
VAEATALSGIKIPSLVEACDDKRLFGITLTPKQRELLSEVESDGNFMHVWALGRRSGKSLLGAIIGLHFCLLRPDLAAGVRPREARYAVCVATSLRQASVFLEMAHSIVESSPAFNGFVENVTDTEIEFKGRTRLAAFPATGRGVRGRPIMALLLDECAHMLDTDGNQAAEPIYRALVPSTAQFGSEARVVVASSPYGADGFFANLYQRAQAGEMPGTVARHGTTAEMNPAISPSFLAAEEQRDPEGFQSEYVALFRSTGEAYLDLARLEAAVGKRTRELRPDELHQPVAALDAAFTRDTCALAIVGRDPSDQRRLRLGLVRSWAPEGGELGFTGLLDEVARVCHDHGVRDIYVDQFCSVPVREHLRGHGLNAAEVTMTASSKSAIYGALKARIYDGSLELYRHEPLLAELKRLEANFQAGQANVRIRRLGSSHGDLVQAVALACSRLPISAGRSWVTNPNEIHPGFGRDDVLAHALERQRDPGSIFVESDRDPLAALIRVADRPRWRPPGGEA